jgi:hypothetical protein
VGDVAGMAVKAIWLLEDEARLAQFKENAKKRAMQFDINEIVPLYEQFYVEIISKSKLISVKAVG